MSRKIELRRRVKRLLANEFHPEDLTHLFLFLRERNSGIWTIREIGDFVAHSSERCKGTMTNEVREFFIHMRILIPALRGHKVNLSDAPPNFPEALHGNFRRLRSDIIKDNTGLERRAALAALKLALGKLQPKSNGRLSLNSPLTTDELAVIECSLGSVTATPLFTDNDLFRDFSAALIKENLLEENEKSNMKYVKSGLSLYAMSRMHLTDITYTQNTKAELHLTNNDGKLGIWAGSECPINERETVTLHAPFFSTNLNTSDWVTPDLFGDSPGCFSPIEVTDEPRLVLL